MTDLDIRQTRNAMKNVEKKHAVSETKAKAFLVKMGYLTKSGKVAKAYAVPKGKLNAA